MASKAQIDRIAARIEALAGRLTLSEPPPERWIVDGHRAYQLDQPDQIITAAELEALPTGRTQFPTRIVHVIVDPVPDGGAA
jgi:hypothetical protein